MNWRRACFFQSAPLSSLDSARPPAPRFSAIPYLDESRFIVIESDSNADACAACWTDSSKTDLTECERSSRSVWYEFEAAIRANMKAKLARIKAEIASAILNLDGYVHFLWIYCG